MGSVTRTRRRTGLVGSSSLMTCVAEDLNTIQSSTRYHCEVNLLAQFISLVSAEKDVPDQVSCVELASKRIQSF